MKKTGNQALSIIIGIVSVFALTRFIPMDGFAFAWALNFLLMMCVLAFTEALKSQFASSYYDEKEWEKRGKVYEYFGITFYRKLLVWTGWERVSKKSNPVQKNREALMNLHYQTKKSEFGHLIILFIVLGFNVFVAFKFGILKSLWLLILNILLNLYPIFLQRYNRPRIKRAINLSNGIQKPYRTAVG